MTEGLKGDDDVQHFCIAREHAARIPFKHSNRGLSLSENGNGGDTLYGKVRSLNYALYYATVYTPRGVRRRSSH